MWCAYQRQRCFLSWCNRFCGQSVLVVFVILVFVGCSKPKETVKMEEGYLNRANDKGYIASLTTNRQQQALDSRALFDVSLKMTQCVTRVKATLPADATNEALTKALAVDPEWTMLDEQSKKLKLVADATLQQAKKMIVQRLQEEGRVKKAVADGKARALDGVSAPNTTEKK